MDLILVGMVDNSEVRLPLTDGSYVIGRADDAGLKLAQPSVSRRHAVIQVGEDGVFLEDCGSRNGTFRRAERIKGVVRLEDRDEFAVGGVLLTVRVSHRDEHLAGGGSSRSTAPLSPAAEMESTSAPVAERDEA